MNYFIHHLFLECWAVPFNGPNTCGLGHTLKISLLQRLCCISGHSITPRYCVLAPLRSTLLRSYASDHSKRFSKGHCLYRHQSLVNASMEMKYDLLVVSSRLRLPIVAVKGHFRRWQRELKSPEPRALWRQTEFQALMKLIITAVIPFTSR